MVSNRIGPEPEAQEVVMDDAAKSRGQLLKELEQLRNRVATLEIDQSVEINLPDETTERIASRILPLGTFLGAARGSAASARWIRDYRID